MTSHNLYLENHINKLLSFLLLQIHAKVFRSYSQPPRSSLFSGNNNRFLGELFTWQFSLVKRGVSHRKIKSRSVVSLCSNRFQSSYCGKVRAGSFLFFALFPTFSTNSRGNAWHAGYPVVFFPCWCFKLSRCIFVCIYLFNKLNSVSRFSL